MNNPHYASRRHQLNVPRQRGVALVVALIMLIPITYVAASLATRVAVEEIMSSNQRDGAQALFIADTGIEVALTAIEKQVVGDSFDALLSYAISHGGQLLDDVGGIALTDIAYGGGTYSIFLRDNDDGDGNLAVDLDDKVILTSVASAVAGVRTVETIVELAASAAGVSQYGILTEKKIDISGDLEFVGTGASIHSNELIDISGNPEIDETVSSDGSINISGNPIIGSIEANADAIAVPHVLPQDFKSYANYIFSCHCRVYDKDGVQIANVNNGKWHGWDCSDEDKWTLGEDNIGSSGFIYIEGNAIVSGSPGEVDNTPMKLTLIVDGYLEISGNPFYTSYANPDHPDAIQQLLFVAGGDLKINGNTGNLIHGVMGAHREVAISGNPSFEGSIVANNHNYQAPNPDNCQEEKNIIDDNYFSGNPHMVNNLESVFNPNTGPVSLNKFAWRELVN